MNNDEVFPLRQSATIPVRRYISVPVSGHACLKALHARAGAVLEILQARRNLRVEWYIVILIVGEILLTLYELFYYAHG